MSDETQGTASPPAEGTTTAATVAEQGTTQQVTEGQTPEGEQQAEQAGDKPEGEQTERKRLSGAQKAKRRETYLLNQLADRERELQELRSNRTPEGEKTENRLPKEEDFNGDWTAYVAALAAHKAGEAVESKLNARETRAQEARRSEAERERDLAHLERVEDAREVIADYDKVMAGMKGVNVPADVIREIKSSEKGALIAYELARNPDRLQALSQMTPMELAREMGRLEASVKMPSGKKQTTAPPPPTNLKGGAAPAFDAAKASMAEYAADFAKRMKEGAA